MDIKLIETFVTVVRNGSSTAAAKVLGISQPAVSLQLAKLEKAAGFELFNRTPSGLVITPEGQRFLPEAISLLQAWKKLHDVREGIRINGLGALTVASHPSAAVSVMPYVADAFARQYPDVKLRLINRMSEEILTHFPGTGVDIAVCELSRDLPGVQVRRIKIRTHVILPLDHPLAAREILTPTDLSGEPFIAMPPERLIAHQVRSAFDEAGALYNPVAEVDYFASICVMVAAGRGISVVDAFSARNFAPLGLHLRPFLPVIPYEIAILSMPNRPRSALHDTYLALLETHLLSEGIQ